MAKKIKKEVKSSKKRSTKNVVTAEKVVKKIELPKVDFSYLKDKYQTSKWFRLFVLSLFLVFSFAIVDFFVQYLNNTFSVAIIDGVRISRSEYRKRLEKTYGLTTVSNLIQERLVIQGAQKDKVTVSDQEVQDRLNQYYNENGGRDSVLATLAQNNFTEEDVKEQVKIGLMMEKALTPKVTYTDKELEDFFNQYKSVLYGDEKVKFADKKDEIKDYYINNGVQELKDSWITDLEKNAKIQNNIEVKPTYGLFKTTINIVRNITNQIKSTLGK